MEGKSSKGELQSFNIEYGQPSDYEENKTKRILIQTFIFVMTYVSYSFLHFTRQSWSILKPSVESNEPPGLGWEGTNNLGIIDFSFLI